MDSLRVSVIAALLAAFVAVGRAQDTAGSSTPPAAPTATSAPRETTSPVEHRFFDRDNAWLFSAVAASRTLDYFSTLNMRRRGRQEVFLTNEAVDNHAAFAAIEAGGTAVSIGGSYLCHRYHHHRLEHWTSIIHASLAAGGAVRNYCLKTAHPQPGLNSQSDVLSS